jgi:Mlc titration factor MtfA (ptsG expression regulator)
MAKIGEYFTGDQPAAASQPTSTETASQNWQTTYSNLACLYLPYYNRLPDELKQKFLERTFHFRRLKNFHFVGMDEQAEIPILVSAAAVQLTFGLAKYELPFFKDIYISPDAYRSDVGNETYIGHVAPSGIYLSWKHFLQGFNDSTDNVNVAIHELAHALAHESFIEETGVDWDFHADFAKFSEASGPEMAKWFTVRKSYLRPYAFTDFQEFWAVSVEAFFENPAELKQNLPSLYSCLCAVLNQDLLSPTVVLPQQ